MIGAKGAAKDAPNTDSEEGPFGRLTNFARRLLAVPKAEIDKEERAYKKKRAKNQGGDSPYSGA